MKDYCIPIILIFSFFLWNIAFAQEEDSIKMDEIVVTATRKPTSPDNTSASVSIIPENQISSSIANDLSDLLKTANVVNISDYGPGSLSMASIRGSSSGQVLVLVDGQRINDSRSGIVDLHNIPLTSVERIEIIRGGQSAMYGADAVGGIINIITKKPNKSQAKVWSSLGAYNSTSYGLEASRKFSSVSGLLAFSKTSFKSDFPFENKYGEKMIRENAESDARSLFGKLQWDVLPSASLKISGDHSYSERGDPGPIGQYTPEAEKREKANNIKGTFEHNLNQWLLYKLTCHKRDATMRYMNPGGMYPSDDTHKTDNIGAEMQLYMLQDTPIPLIWGFSLANDDVTSTALGDKERKTYSAYYHQEFRKKLEENPFYLSEIAAFPAFRWDYYSDFEAGLSPKIGFLASFGEKRFASIKANLGRSYKAPTLNDLYWPADAFATGNPDLKPERSKDFDMGLYFYLNNARLGASVFKNSYSNRIQWTPGESGKWSPQNLSDVNSEGVESEINFVLPLWNIPDFLQIGTNYTFVKAEDSLKRQLIYRPKHSAGYTLRAGNNKIWCQLQGLYQSERYYTVQNTKWLDSFMKHDFQVGLGRRFLNTANFGVIFEVKNIFDKKYLLVADYPLPGREWSIKTSISMEGE